MHIYILVKDLSGREIQRIDTSREALRDGLRPILCDHWGTEDFNHLCHDLEAYNHQNHIHLGCLPGDVCSAVPCHPSKRVEICFVEQL